MTRKISQMIAAGFFLLCMGVGSTAWAQLAPFPGTKALMYGPDPVGIGKDVPTEFTFQITLNANNFDATNSVMDVVPAEFDVVKLDSSCGMAESVEGEGRQRGRGQGDPTFKLAPDVIVWDLEDCNSARAQTLTVVIETDLNPGHAKHGSYYYEPTSCGPLFLSDGAVLMRGESDEASTEPSNALMVASCPDEYDLEGCVDTDQDGLSVACGDNEGCQPTPEICDGLDNDCDGEVDNGFGPFEICDDGLDNNCNGWVDEDCGGSQ